MKMMKTLFTSVFYFIISSTVLAQNIEEPILSESTEYYSIIKIFLDNPEQLYEMKTQNVAYDHINGDLATGMKILLTQDEIPKLDKLGITYEVIMQEYAESNEMVEQRTELTYGSSLEIHPNPAINKLQIELKDLISSKLKTATIATHFGEIVQSFELDNSSKDELDIAELEGGKTYLLIVISADGSSFIEKFYKV